MNSRTPRRPQTARRKHPTRQQRFRDYVRKKRRILLQPAAVTVPEGVWRKMESLGITEKDIEGAVRWARKRK